MNTTEFTNPSSQSQSDEIQSRQCCGPQSGPYIGVPHMGLDMFRIPRNTWFPLGADSQITLVQCNIYRGLISNAMALGLSVQDMLPEDARSTFNVAQQNPIYDHIPPALRPTQLQRSMLHHPWIDLLPFPTIRDNLLMAGSMINRLEICADVTGIFGMSVIASEAHDPVTTSGLIVWGEPWEPGSWEITPTFFQKWAAFFTCPQAIAGTRMWRSKRVG